ncbi:type II/IV secretion system protein [Sulfurimonas sp.]|uniref:type II/IV secretion system protein n=1 Tax=Sulfurimonas sp. TaxID=2022749 RepID=UPI00286E62B0|nr:type II/IV secretion system protein [Sulfurimonas sp.]
MKKAFTMMELIFIIIVIGILAAVVIPRTGSNKLHEAAIQVVSHIRYTQHLAMVDDKFNTADNEWYKDRWQIMFANTAGSGNSWSYMIFSDSLGASTGTPDVNEHAVNPLDSSKFLTGGYSAGNIAFDDARATAELNIGKEYRITNVTFSANCEINSKRISFDHLGRPLYDGPHLLDEAYRDGANSRLIQFTSGNPCTITLTDGSDNVVIAIEPETGYAHIL